MRRANVSKAKLIEEIEKVSVTVGEMSHKLTFLVMKGAPCSLVFKRLPMKNMIYSLGIDSDIASFTLGTTISTVPLRKDKEQDEEALSEEFTSDGEKRTKTQSGEHGNEEASTEKDENQE